MPGGRKRKHRWEAALAALLSEKTLAEAAARAGISERTLKEWLRQPDFQAAYADARKEVLRGTVTRLLGATGQAVDALVQLLGCDHAPTRARAADLVLGYSLKGLEVADLTEELEGLRRELEGLRRERGDAETAGGGTAAGGPGPA